MEISETGSAEQHDPARRATSPNKLTYPVRVTTDIYFSLINVHLLTLSVAGFA